MAIASNKNMAAVVLSAVVLAGIVAAAAVYFYSTPATSPDVMAPETANVPTGTSMTTNANFNTGVLNRSEYTALDIGLVTQGRLPVQPPVGVGKANPFQ